MHLSTSLDGESLAIAGSTLKIITIRVITKVADTNTFEFTAIILMFFFKSILKQNTERKDKYFSVICVMLGAR
jgi:hypothetical protein